MYHSTFTLNSAAEVARLNKTSTTQSLREERPFDVRLRTVTASA